MLPALAQVSTLQASFAKDVEDYAAGQCHAIEVWLTKLETYLAEHSRDDLRRLLDEHQMQLPVASYQGGLLDSQGDARREHWGLFARRLQFCRKLGIGTLVLAADIAGPLSQEMLDRISVSLTQAAQQAGPLGVRLALEPQGRAAFCNNLQTAASLVAEVGSPHLGLCLDAFHYYIGPSKTEDLAYLSAENLFHVQLSDVAGQARELASDADRVLPGDGDIPLEPIIEHLRRIGYTGCVSVELLNPQIYQVPPRQFGEIAMTVLRKLLGQAAMQ